MIMFLILNIAYCTTSYPNVGKLYIGYGCHEENLFGIASVLKKSSLGFLQLPRVIGTCQQESYYDEYFEQEIDVAMIEECDEETNIITIKGWHNSTECLETPSDWEDEREMGECHNHSTTEISTVDWCVHEINEDLPHLSIYGGDSCAEATKMYDLWVRPNYCIFVDFEDDDDVPISFLIKKDDSNQVSAHQYNSTDCDESTEIWSAQYVSGVCNLAATETRRTITIGISLANSNVLLIGGGSSYLYWLIPIIVGIILVIVAFGIGFYLYQRSKK